MLEKTVPYDTGFPPIAHQNARLLILGSMPGIKSLTENQYYAHPRNAFWFIMEALFDIDRQLDYHSRRQQLIENRIAIWDVLYSCQRPGSLDQHIVTESISCNDFNSFFNQHPAIERICFNGAKAEQLYKKHVLPKLDNQFQQIATTKLPSTSPAHASLSMEQKMNQWRKALL